MKRINYFLTLAILFTGLTLFAQKSTVNTEKSTVEWVGKKIGGQHNGNIKLKSGSLELKDGNIAGGEFVIDMNSMTCLDLEDEGYNQKLIGHLKSDDFFGVATYPTATFKVTKATPFKDGKAKVSGNITIKGKTEPISFDVVKKENTYSASIDVDRSKFDVRYGSTSFFDSLGDKAIDDIFNLNVKLVLK